MARAKKAITNTSSFNPIKEIELEKKRVTKRFEDKKRLDKENYETEIARLDLARKQAYATSIKGITLDQVRISFENNTWRIRDRVTGNNISYGEFIGLKSKDAAFEFAKIINRAYRLRDNLPGNVYVIHHKGGRRTVMNLHENPPYYGKVNTRQETLFPV